MLEHMNVMMFILTELEIFLCIHGLSPILENRQAYSHNP